MSPWGITLGFIPSFVWLFFYLGEDPHPEPKRLLGFTFILGGISTIFALFMQVTLKNQFGLSNLSLESFSGSTFTTLILFALVEEVAKFGAAYFAVARTKDFDEPIDAMIYMIVASLGFAAVENIAVLQGQFSSQTLIASAIGITTSRLIGATLLHTLASAFVGYYWALSLKNGKLGFILMGLASATLLHAGFNFLILNYEGLVYPIALLVVGGFFALQDFEELKTI